MSIKSNSEKYFEKKGDLPQVSGIMAKSVSEQRREMLGKEVDLGYFKEGSGSNGSGLTAAAGVVAGSSGISKSAQLTSTYSYQGSGDTVKQTPEVYSPLWLSSNLNLPRDRATINAWCRSFYALNPFVHNAINLHSTYPISKLSIKCPNKEVEKFFNDMIEEIDLMNICVQIAQEFWLLGEAFVYAEYDASKGKWSRLFIQNPDYMVLNRTAIAGEPSIKMRPDENLKKMVFSNRPSDIEQRKQLNQHIIDCVKRGESIPLDNFNVSHLARKITPYEIHGTGLPVCIFRQLMLFDKLRESKYAQADNMINPTTIVKIGGGDGGYKPTQADLEHWRNIFESAQNDKDFKIFTHEGVSVERVGYGAGIYDISGDITQLVKEIYTGLQVPSVLMDGGADTTYSNGGVALDVLRQRYMQFRNMMSSWLKRKIFAPISKVQGFYEYKGKGDKAEKQLIIPEVDWNHMSLFDAQDYISQLVTLTGGEGEQRRVSLHTLYRSLGLEWEDEQRKVRKESISSVIAKKEKEALEAMDLVKLRALGDDDEIQENKEAPSSKSEPVPGESGGNAPPDMGGLPGMAPPPAP